MTDQEAEALRKQLGLTFGSEYGPQGGAPPPPPPPPPPQSATPRMSDMQADSLKQRLNETFGAQGGAPMTDGQAGKLRGQLSSTFGKDQFSLPSGGSGMDGLTGEELDAMSGAGGATPSKAAGSAPGNSISDQEADELRRKMSAMQGMTAMSDRRVKTGIRQGASATRRFLDALYKSGAR